MTGTINPELPSGGEPRNTSDGKIKGSLITLRDGINNLLNSENKVATASLAESKLAWYTPKVIATEESRANTAFGTLTTPDEITGVVVPANGLIAIEYLAKIKSSGSAEGRAAIFISANQLKNSQTAEVQEASTSLTLFTTLMASPGGLVSLTGSAGLVTTGQALGNSAGSGGGTCRVSGLPAGTYTVSVKYMALSGSVTAKERTLWVSVFG